MSDEHENRLRMACEDLFYSGSSVTLKNNPDLAKKIGGVILAEVPRQRRNLWSSESIEVQLYENVVFSITRGIRVLGRENVSVLKFRDGSVNPSAGYHMHFRKGELVGMSYQNNQE